MKPSEERLQIRNSHLAANYLKDKVSTLDHEELWALYLTKDLSLIVCEMLTKGSLDATIMDSRTVIKRALLVNATSVILAHNHPSGNPRPGANDIRQTEKIRSACTIMDIALLDHIILAENAYFSFADEITVEYNHKQ